MKTGHRSNRAATILLGAVCLLGLLAGPVGSANFKDPRKIKFPPLGKIRTPEIVRHVLESNGLIIYMLEDHDFSLVDYRVMVRVAKTYEPQELRGLAEITGDVLRTGGTVSVPGDELDARLESIGAFIESSIGGTEGTISASFLTDNAIEGLGLLGDVLRNPAFPQEKIDLAKVEMRTSIAARNDEPIPVAFREFRKLMYGGDSPYGWHPEYETIESVTRDDMVRFHGAFFHPDRMILTISGDFDFAAMLAEVERVFGDWAPLGRPLPPDPPVSEKGPQGVYYARKEGVTQSTVLFGLMGTLASDPDYAELQILNEILGGGFSSRLFNNIRTKRGLAYAVGSAPGVGWHHVGTWLAYALTQSESTLVSLRLLKEEIVRITQEPVTEEELQCAKDIVLSQLVFDLSTKGAVLNRKAFYEFYGYPPDFLERYQERVATLTTQDLFNAARHHIRPEEMVTLVIGQKEDFAQPLEDLGEIHEIDISIPEPPSRFEVPVATAEALEKGRQILAAAAAAHGGADLKRVTSVQKQGSGTVSMMGQEMSFSYSSANLLPDRSWTQMNFGGMFAVTTVLDGETGWRQTPQGTLDLAGDELAEARDDLIRSPLHVLTHWEGMRWQALEPREIDGVLCDVVYAIGTPIKEWLIYFDRTTHLVRGMDYPGRSQRGPVRAAERFGDYRRAEGIQSAFAVTIFHDGEKIVDISMSAVEINTPVDRSLFEKPE
jgi:zinc protease